VLLLLWCAVCCASGVGNIYRAEILYKTGLHPEQPGFTVDRDTFDVGFCVTANILSDSPTATWFLLSCGSLPVSACSSANAPMLLLLPHTLLVTPYRCPDPSFRPLLPAATAAPTQVLWGHCVDLLHRGFTSGSILTVDPEDARQLGKPWTRR
jgi:hypothetical protein